jgi:hypothetical protein
VSTILGEGQDVQVTNIWTDCYVGKPEDETGTATIIQSGDTFSIILGEGEIQAGSIKATVVSFRWAYRL